ncbi:MAG TPA: phosphotransferase family protein [Casimicrobiaceae bacterium]|nr:phosphotransferase family protein [Casimicrobiaceae bacterium]
MTDDVERIEQHAAVASWLRRETNARDVAIVRFERLEGGAVADNWRLDVAIDGGPWQGERRFVLRTDPALRIAASHSRADEFAVLRNAHDANVLAPAPRFLCTDSSVLGRSFFVMDFLPGVAAGHRLTREQALVPDPSGLARALGENLARIHAVPAPSSHRVPNPAIASIEQYRRWLEGLDDAYPALEWGLRWCELRAPSRFDITLIHRDYRTGNYLVDAGRLVAVLDWEFAGFGDPREDLGWFTARCWRFARPDLEAGGIAALEPFLEGYEAQGGRAVSRSELDYWQAMAHSRWAIIALQQARRHREGDRSLELALTGRIVHELEYEALRLMGAKKAQASRRSDRKQASSDIADAADLLATARETLLSEIVPSINASKQRYNALMTANAMAIAARELSLGDEVARREAERLRSLATNVAAPEARDVDDLPGLRRAVCVAIREGRFDDSVYANALAASLAEIAADRVAISNPRALRDV